MANIRVSQIIAEPMVQGGNIRVSQVVIEPMRQGGNIRVSQIIAEVMYATTIGTPGNLHAGTITSTTIQMLWDAQPTATSYSLQYRAVGVVGWTTVAGIVGTSQTLTSLVPGQVYEFQINATNGSTTSAWSGSVLVQALPVVQDVPAVARSLDRYRGSVGINWGGFVLIGDAFSGVVGQADFESFTEYGNIMEVVMTSPPVHSDRKRVFVDRIEIDVESGVGLVEGQGSEPQWMLDWSKDGARTWGPLQIWRSMGRLGEYLTRLRWLKLGASRQWVFRLRSTDPVRRVIIGAYIDSREGMK